MSRKTARQHAFHLIYTFNFHQGVEVADLAKAKASYYEFLDENDTERYDLGKLPKPRGRDAEYVDRAFWGVFERLNELDGVIQQFLRDWTPDRIASVDLAIMRLAVYEMLCEPDVPSGVAVNEAVELAKQYGTDDSPSFINGVLGNISRELGKRKAV